MGRGNRVKRQRKSSRQLRVESLEPRMVLSALGLVPVGQQPQGGLSGKIVYTHGGHGWTADNQGTGAWSTQRPETFEMIEDLGNQDQMSFFADYLFRAGATVVPLRPVGHQPNEVVLDNDDTEVTFSGPWSDSSSTIYYGDVGDVPYRYAATSSTETAVARYRPNIPVAGFYPVYAWARYGSDRAADHLYRVQHSGGITEVTINHRRVGNGMVYLGTYHFDGGTDGYVDISNRSSETGRVVIADAIRFGNGMGDINRGGGVSGFAREDEAGLYWVQRQVDDSTGIPASEYRTSASDRSATVSLSPRYAEYMNREADGSLADRAFISFHSNAGGGAARGVLALYNGNNTASSATPNQQLMATTLGREVNDDLVAQAGDFEHNWNDRGSSVTLDRSDIEFGEINNTYIQNEFDATIIETGYHDNQQDAEMLRDPRVRDALARATYQGLVDYFRLVDGRVTPATTLPPPVESLRAQVAGADSVTLSWTPPTASSYAGDAPTGYRIYTSLDGYGFDGGTVVSGGSTSSHTLTGLDADAGTYYFKVVAVNVGGESADSHVVAAAPNASSTKILIVDGFDRYERRLDPRVSYGATVVDRVRPRFSNSFDYAVQAGEAIEAYSTDLVVETVPNEWVTSGSFDMSEYAAVVWILGEESSVDSTFDPFEQAMVTGYLATGGNLFVSGSEIGWDLDNLNNGRSFYNNQLHANYVADDANSYSTVGVSGSIFDGLSISFDDGSLFYDVTYPDVISPVGGATSALTYIGGTGGTAAIQYDGGQGGDVVTFGFPFETITTGSGRADVMQRILDFFEITPIADGDFNQDQQLDCDDLLLLSQAIHSGSTDLTLDVDGSGVIDAADVTYWITDIKQTYIGDANLDFSVDVSDFSIWNANRFQPNGYWCTADFNTDGTADVSDYGIWNSAKFPVAPPLQGLPAMRSSRSVEVDVAGQSGVGSTGIAARTADVERAAACDAVFAIDSLPQRQQSVLPHRMTTRFLKKVESDRDERDPFQRDLQRELFADGLDEME